MPLPEPPQYTAAEIEKRAAAFLSKQFGSDVPIPVDIDYLLESQPGVKLDYIPTLRSDHRTEGMIVRDTDSRELTVYIDEWLADTQRNRYRFTVAEELGHIVLHRSLIDQINDESDSRELQNHYQWHTLERNAKRFGAAVLMPPERVIRAAEEWYPKLVDAAGFGSVEAIVKVLTSKLAEEFQVSAGAMRYRLTEWPLRIKDRIERAMRDHLDYLA